MGETVQSEAGEVAGKGSGRLNRRGIRLWLRRLFKIAVVLGLIPVVLTILYLPPFVRPVSTLMLADLVTLKGYDRQWVSIDDISPVLIHSVIMSEDGQFCNHYGVDLGELKKVILDPRGPSRGASTITMQSVKNLYLWPRPFGTIRKILELPYATYVDLVMSKRRIMEIYLNIAEWGPGIYGIEAAAQHHFGVSAKNLSRKQAALLAVTLPNPILRNPAKPSRDMRFLANRVQRLAARSGAYVQCVE
ncbi:biosynthetic peptidoglycan transglycosylase [Mesorhizobium yinganensis]|uniref:biosynthetic peptidoglycan transglycosylase n=1 Tax=Mesorhizobium yinganensis TaxID=3157707 RepID=UPI003CCDDBCD